MTPVLTNLPAVPAPDAGGESVRECGRYRLDGLTRVLCTRVAHGQIELLDIPAGQFDNQPQGFPSTDSYLVEPGLSTDRGELEALVADYLQQAAHHQRVPMSVPLLEQLIDTRPL